MVKNTAIKNEPYYSIKAIDSIVSSVSVLHHKGFQKVWARMAGGIKLINWL